MPTQKDVEYVRGLWEQLLKEYQQTGNEQLPPVCTYLCAAWMAMRLLMVQPGPKQGGRKNG